jgi:hypothetical protein
MGNMSNIFGKESYCLLMGISQQPENVSKNKIVFIIVLFLVLSQSPSCVYKWF